jgi:hypothetical protein
MHVAAQKILKKESKAGADLAQIMDPDYNCEEPSITERQATKKKHEQIVAKRIQQRETTKKKAQVKE